MNSTIFVYTIGCLVVEIGSSAGGAYCMFQSSSWTQTITSCCFAPARGVCDRFPRMESTLLKLLGGVRIRIMYIGPWSPKTSPFSVLPLSVPVAASGSDDHLQSYDHSSRCRSTCIRALRWASQRRTTRRCTDGPFAPVSGQGQNIHRRRARCSTQAERSDW